jgi:hypothetical protein
VLSVDGAYDKSLEVLSRLLGLSVPKRAVETSVTEHSSLVDAFYAQQAPVPVEEEGSILVVQADGKGVPMVRSETADLKVRRGKGDKKTRKKEAIAIAVYTIAPYRRTPQDVVNALFKKDPPVSDRPTPSHKRIFASLKGKPANLQQLAEWATQRDGPAIQQRVALTDGAEACDQLCEIVHFMVLTCPCRRILGAGSLLYWRTDHRAVGRSAVADLCRIGRRKSSNAGQQAKTLSAFKRECCSKSVICAAINMDYATYLQRGWPIGAGA